MNKKVVFTLHAEDKLKRLMKIGGYEGEGFENHRKPCKSCQWILWTQDSTGLIKRRFNIKCMKEVRGKSW